MRVELENTAKYKSKKFAVRIVNLYKYLCNERNEFVLSKQILRSGTSIGANIAEYLKETEYNSIKNDCEELRKMLSSTTKTLSSTLNSQNSTLEGGTNE